VSTLHISWTVASAAAAAPGPERPQIHVRGCVLARRGHRLAPRSLRCPAQCRPRYGLALTLECCSRALAATATAQSIFPASRLSRPSPSADRRPQTADRRPLSASHPTPGYTLYTLRRLLRHIEAANQRLFARVHALRLLSPSNRPPEDGCVSVEAGIAAHVARTAVASLSPPAPVGGPVQAQPVSTSPHPVRFVAT
jgi:hypothetical protein